MAVTSPDPHRACIESRLHGHRPPSSGLAPKCTVTSSLHGPTIHLVSPAPAPFRLFRNASGMTEAMQCSLPMQLVQGMRWMRWMRWMHTEWMHMAWMLSTEQHTMLPFSGRHPPIFSAVLGSAPSMLFARTTHRCCRSRVGIPQFFPPFSGRLPFRRSRVFGSPLGRRSRGLAAHP